MKTQPVSVLDLYTRKVGGETFQYEVQYTPGHTVPWQAKVYLDGELKGSPSGSIIDNVMSGEALKQFVISYVEGMIERGIGIDE
ncbi:MAG TPA: hypothetical protein VIP51_06200 [Eoetvoesiella sp.]